jgi:hypothetical protein
LSQTWNIGIVELWNIGLSKDFIHLKLYIQDEFCSLPNMVVSSTSRKLHEPEANMHFSNIPAFHHSNWGEAHTSLVDFISIIKLFSRVKQE